MTACTSLSFHLTGTQIQFIFYSQFLFNSPKLIKAFCNTYAYIAVITLKHTHKKITRLGIYCHLGIKCLKISPTLITVK